MIETRTSIRRFEPEVVWEMERLAPAVVPEEPAATSGMPPDREVGVGVGVSVGVGVMVGEWVAVGVFEDGGVKVGVGVSVAVGAGPGVSVGV